MSVISSATSKTRSETARLTVLNEAEQISVPPWVKDLGSFRHWLDADDVPEQARIYYIKGEVFIDMTKEQVFSHVLVKTEYTIVLGGLVKAEQRGLFLVDGVRLSNLRADLSAKPDGTFIATETLRSQKVRLVQGKKEGYVELEGSPDMALEVISSSTVHKDTVLLRQAYWEAGIREFWLVDARREPLTFDILRHTGKGYVATRKQDGWVKSAVFGKSFQLMQRVNALGHPEYALAVR